VAALGAPEEVLDEEVLSAAFGSSVRVIRTEDGELVVAPTRRTSSAEPVPHDAQSTEAR